MTFAELVLLESLQARTRIHVAPAAAKLLWTLTFALDPSRKPVEVRGPLMRAKVGTSCREAAESLSMRSGSMMLCCWRSMSELGKR